MLSHYGITPEDLQGPFLLPKLKALGFTRTHDAQFVFPHFAEVPPWAHGFTQCQHQGGAYSSWLETQDDRDRSKVDYQRIEAEAKAMRTKVQAVAALATIGVTAYPEAKLRSLRLLYQVCAYKRLWPLRETQASQVARLGAVERA